MAMSQIGILLVTHNAHGRLKLLLESLNGVDVSEIIIADSSDLPYASTFDKHITYYHCPGLSLIRKILVYSEKIHSEFIFLHPDGELVNPYALRYISQQLGLGNNEISSTLAQNLTFKNNNQIINIKSRNYKLFTGNAIHCLNNYKDIENCISPYHQMIWGVHKGAILRQFFAVAATIPWDRDSWMHVCLFERLFNVFMHLSGRIIVSTLPLLLRLEERSSDLPNANIQSAALWLSKFEQGSKRHMEFLDFVVKRCQTGFGIDANQFKTTFLKMLKNESIWRNSLIEKTSFLQRLQKKLYGYFFDSADNNYRHKELSLDADVIHIEADSMSETEFELYLSAVIPFLKLKHNELKRFS